MQIPLCKCFHTDFARISLATIGVCVFVRLLRWAHFLFFGGVMRRVDRLGRIVIPLEMREKYGLCEGAEIEFIDSGDGVTVRSSEPFCKLCRAKIDVGANIPLCDDCIAEIAKLYSEKK